MRAGRSAGEKENEPRLFDKNSSLFEKTHEAAARTLEQGKSLLDGFLKPFAAAKAERLKRQADEARKDKIEAERAERRQKDDQQREEHRLRQQTAHQAKQDAERQAAFERIAQERTEKLRRRAQQKREHQHTRSDKMT